MHPGTTDAFIPSFLPHRQQLLPPPQAHTTTTLGARIASAGYQMMNPQNRSLKSSPVHQSVVLILLHTLSIVGLSILLGNMGGL